MKELFLIIHYPWALEFVHGRSKIQMICESDTDDYPRALKLVPNWFVKLNWLEYYLDIETVKS